MDGDKLKKLRLVINENLRVQRGGAEAIPYIDVTSVLSDIAARQNHAVFGRRGCGKTLLLHHSARNLDSSIQCVYLNCEDFKKHCHPQFRCVLFALLQPTWPGRPVVKGSFAGMGTGYNLESRRQSPTFSQSRTFSFVFAPN